MASGQSSVLVTVTSRGESRKGLRKGHTTQYGGYDEIQEAPAWGSGLRIVLSVKEECLMSSPHDIPFRK